MALACVAGLLGLTGCIGDGHFKIAGYTTEPNYDRTITSVYVPIAQNITMRRGLEFDLTRAVVRELGAKTTFRVVSNRCDADTELDIRIINRRKLVVLPDQINLVRDADIGLTAEVVWRDLRPGKVGDILSNPRRFDPNELPLPGQPAPIAPKAVPVLVSLSASYQPELGGSVTTAEKAAIDRAAVQIVSMMEKPW